MAPHPPDPVTASRLLQLRTLLEEAVVRSGDSTDVGVHTAIVLLDGACEYALNLAGRSRGARKEHLEDLYSELVDKHQLTPLPQWAGVRQLHRARNLTHHHAVPQAATNLPKWTTDADGFIRELIANIFGVQLADVHLADDVRNVAFREPLLDAEAALDQGEAGEAIVLAGTAFEAARRSYIAHRDDESGWPRPYPLDFGERPDGETREAVARAEELVEVAPFAADMGEYAWFANEVQLARAGLPRSDDDARRAIAFALGWARRFEAYLDRYPTGALAEYRRSVRGPRSGVADAEPSIRSVKVDGSYSRGGEQFANVTVQLQDVPDEHHHQWLQFLNEDFSRRDPADPAASWGPRMFDLAGVVHLHPPLYATGSAEILGELRDAIARTQDRYRHWLTTESERQADAQAAVEPYREQLLTQAADGVAVIEEVRGRASEGRFVGRFEQLVSLRVRLDESRVSYELLHELLNEAHIPARPRWFREGDVFSIPLEYANPHDLHEEFAQAVAKAAETAERREQEVAQREQRLRVLQEAFDESL